jgi:hypothetical protein
VHTILPNRLAYPEHFITYENFYDKDEELKIKINNFLNNKKLNNNNIVAQYDWNILKSKYTEIFKKLGSLDRPKL